MKEGIKEKLNAFHLALETKIMEEWGPCKVSWHELPNPNNRCSFIIGVTISTQNASQSFEIWKPHSGDQYYWDKASPRSFSFHV